MIKGLLVLLVLGGAISASAYEVRAGDLVGRVVVGPSVNGARYAAATRATPGGGLLLGAGLEMSIADHLGLVVDLHESLAPGFADTRVSAGIRARIRTVDAPVIPYGSLSLTTAVGLPLGNGEAHWNLGIRAAGGVEYWLTRSFSLGVELGIEPSILVFPESAVEMSLEGLLCAGWRF